MMNDESSAPRKRVNKMDRMRTIIVMTILALASAFAGVGVATAAQHHENDECVVTAPVPTMRWFKSGKSAKKQWHQMSDENRFEAIEKHYDQLREKTRIQKAFKHHSLAQVILWVGLAIAVVCGLLPAHVAALATFSTQTLARHDWVPEVDHNGNSWSDEQLSILNHVADCLQNENDDEPIRLCIQAVAGSGKTTVLRGLLGIIASAHQEGNTTSLTATAFNKTIADILGDTMKSVKPTNADWVVPGSGTLNAHGHRTVLNHFEHQMGTPNDRKYSVLARIAATELLADDLLRAEWLANTELNRGGHPKSKSAWYALARLLENTTLRAMGNGLFLDGIDVHPLKTKDEELHPHNAAILARSNEAWDDFMLENQASLRLAEAPVGPMIIAKLESTCRWIVNQGMDLLYFPNSTVKPEMGHVWIGGPVKGSLRQINTTTVADLDDIGAVLVPLKNGSPKPSADADGVVIPYRTSGNFAHDRLEVVLPRLSSDEFKAVNGALRNTNWPVKFGHANQGNSVNPSFDVRPKNSDGWVRSIKPACVDQFTQVVSDATNGRVVLTAAFNRALEGDTDDATSVPKSHYAFIDQIYAPSYFNMKAWRTFDFILADEVQDMSKLQGSMLRKLGSENASFVIVGDTRQSIYGFSGASPDSMQYNADTLDCVEMPMTICWRQTTTLANEVSQLLGSDEAGNKTEFADHRAPVHIESWPVGESSKVEPMSHIVDNVQIGDMVLSRITAPLVHNAIAVLKDGVPARLAGGGDLESRLTKLLGISALKMVNKDGDEMLPLSDVHDAIESYLHDERSGLLPRLIRGRHKQDETAARADEEYTGAVDYCVALLALIGRYHNEGLDAGQPNAQLDSTTGFVTWLSDLFVDPNDTGEHYVLFSSIHRAKGLEREHCHILCDRETSTDDGGVKITPNFMLPFCMNTDDEIKQELDCVYVGITRSQKTNTYYTYSGATTIQDAMSMLPTGGWPVDGGDDDSDDDDSDAPVIDDESPVDDEQMMEIVLADKLLESCEDCGGKLALTGHPNSDTVCLWCAKDWLEENKDRFEVIDDSDDDDDEADSDDTPSEPIEAPREADNGSDGGNAPLDADDGVRYACMGLDRGSDDEATIHYYAKTESEAREWLSCVVTSDFDLEVHYKMGTWLAGSLNYGYEFAHHNLFGYNIVSEPVIDDEFQTKCECIGEHDLRGPPRVCESCIEIMKPQPDDEPVIDDEPVDEPAPKRTRKSTADRLDDMLEIMHDDIAAKIESIESEGLDMPSDISVTYEIKTLATRMGCSPPTVKRVIEDKIAFNNSCIVDWLNVDGLEGRQSWLEIETHYDNFKLNITCERSESGSFKRGRPVWFTMTALGTGTDGADSDSNGDDGGDDEPLLKVPHKRVDLSDVDFNDLHTSIDDEYDDEYEWQPGYPKQCPDCDLMTVDLDENGREEFCAQHDADIGGGLCTMVRDKPKNARMAIRYEITVSADVGADVEAIGDYISATLQENLPLVEELSGASLIDSWKYATDSDDDEPVLDDEPVNLDFTALTDAPQDDEIDHTPINEVIQERADYMARVIKEGRDVSNNRRFSGCIEHSAVENNMVLDILWDKAQRSTKLMANLFKYICADAFAEYRDDEPQDDEPVVDDEPHRVLRSQLPADWDDGSYIPRGNWPVCDCLERGLHGDLATVQERIENGLRMRPDYTQCGAGGHDKPHHIFTATCDIESRVGSLVDNEPVIDDEPQDDEPVVEESPIMSPESLHRLEQVAIDYRGAVDVETPQMHPLIFKGELLDRDVDETDWDMEVVNETPITDAARDYLIRLGKSTTGELDVTFNSEIQNSAIPVNEAIVSAVIMDASMVMISFSNGHLATTMKDAKHHGLATSLQLGKNEGNWFTFGSKNMGTTAHGMFKEMPYVELESATGKLVTTAGNCERRTRLFAPSSTSDAKTEYDFMDEEPVRTVTMAISDKTKNKILTPGFRTLIINAKKLLGTGVTVTVLGTPVSLEYLGKISTALTGAKGQITIECYTSGEDSIRPLVVKGDGFTTVLAPKVSDDAFQGVCSLDFGVPFPDWANGLPAESWVVTGYYNEGDGLKLDKHEFADYDEAECRFHSMMEGTRDLRRVGRQQCVDYRQYQSVTIQRYFNHSFDAKDSGSKRLIPLVNGGWIDETKLEEE